MYIYTCTYIQYNGDVMSANFTVRLPKKILEAMRRYKDVNWSQVIRESIIQHLKRLEEMERVESSESLLNRLVEKGVKMEDLKPLDYNDEVRLYRQVLMREWNRLDSTTQAQ